MTSLSISPGKLQQQQQQAHVLFQHYQRTGRHALSMQQRRQLRSHRVGGCGSGWLFNM
jgi:hypothetical protein